MYDTLVIQSHCSPLPYPWVERCLDSVQGWCVLNQYEYHFIGDELFDYLPDIFLDLLENQRVIASDLARLVALQDALSRGYKTVVWLDADFLIFNPEKFILPDLPYAMGREVWVQRDKSIKSGKPGKLKFYKKIHNALLMFCDSNSFLDFYIETAERLLSLNKGTVPSQFIGPKLLTALHNIAIFPVMETAGMLSPLVIKDILQGNGAALDLFIENSPQPVTGANLCISSCERQEVSAKEMDQLIDVLLDI
ncbi:MAG: hypothetical protein OQK73_11840 [Gammaproteobacteria bacterium]|nr:hypothetical protein [Gammaproteobacteria bacterium]